MKHRKLTVLFLPLLTSVLFSCSNQTGIRQGQSTETAFEKIRNLNVPFIREKDFTLFTYENRNYVVQQNDDYTHIRKVKDYKTVVPSLSDFDRLECGMDLFEVVKLLGIPKKGASAPFNTGFGFESKEGVVKLVFFYSDLSHIRKTC